MTGRLIFAAGLLVGSTTGAVLTAAGLRDDATPEPALAPAQQVECTPTEEPVTPMTTAPPVPYQGETPDA